MCPKNPIEINNPKIFTENIQNRHFNQYFTKLRSPPPLKKLNLSGHTFDLNEFSILTQ